MEQVKKALPEEVKKIMDAYGIQIRSKEKRTPKKCENGKHCERQEIVEESELAERLANGSTFVATLPSGKILVSREA